MPGRFDNFTERARKVVEFAQEEAQRLNHNYIGTEHLLLGLVREGEGVAAKVLGNVGVELNKARSTVEFIIGRGDGDRTVTGDIGLTPRAKRVIELSADEARRLNHQHIGTEHLLLGLVRVRDGVAAGMLESLGISLDKVHSQVIYVLNQSTASGAVSGSSMLPRLTSSESARQTHWTGTEAIGISSGGPPSLDRPDGSTGVFLTFDGTRDQEVCDRITRVSIALSGADAARLWHLLGERLTDEEKAKR